MLEGILMRTESWRPIGISALLPILVFWPVALSADQAELDAATDTVRIAIGVLDGDERQVFGRIREVEVGTDGDIFILDDQALVISWFGPDGTFRGRAGRAGGGPGEFRTPVGMALDRRGLLHVLDQALRRITVFERTAEGLALVRDVRLPVQGGDFCIEGDRYYVLAPLQQGLIHVFTLDGEPLASFGELVADVPTEMKRHEDILRQMQNLGRLLCVAGTQQIVFVPVESPLVRAFGADGALLWETRLRPFYQRRYELSQGGRGIRLAPDPESNSAHTTLSVVKDGETLVVTLAEATLQDPVGIMEWRILALADGRETVRRDASGILAASGPTRRVTFVNHPFPQVFVEQIPQ
jgi:hypothetical protein